MCGYIIIKAQNRKREFEAIRELKMYKSTHRLLLTGTPLQNNLQELWSLLNFLLPEIFDDLGSFESWFDISFLETESSNEAIVVEEQKNSILTMLHKILSPFLLRRVKADVALSIPPKREVLVYAPLCNTQKLQYKSIVDKTIRKLVEGDQEKEMANFAVDKHGRSIRCRKSRISRQALKVMMDDDDNKKQQEFSDEEEDLSQWFSRENMPDDNNNFGSCYKNGDPKQSELNIQLRNVMFMLRRCCNHPYLIEYPLTDWGDYKIDEGIVTTSGKLMLLDKMLTELKKRGHKVLIFSQMVQILNILEDYCTYRGYASCRLDGTMKLEERGEQIHTFNTDPDYFVFLLSTRAGGLGINLTAADTCIIFDSDWNPQCDLQAQDRCHRIGQEKPVMVYRLITANTIDQKIVERAAAKRKLEKMVITKGKFKSGGCWNANENVPADDLLKQHGNKLASSMSSEELLELLKSTDFDSKLEICEKQQVISDQDLEKLLDRSDLWAKMGRKNNDASKPKENNRRSKSTAKTETKYSDVKGVFKVLNEDMGENCFKSEVNGQ